MVVGDRARAQEAARTARSLDLVHALVAGGDCIETPTCCASDPPRPCSAIASWPINPGNVLRSFTFGHVRQLDRVAEQALIGAWAAGAGPASAP